LAWLAHPFSFFLKRVNEIVFASLKKKKHKLDDKSFGVAIDTMSTSIIFGSLRWLKSRALIPLSYKSIFNLFLTYKHQRNISKNLNKPIYKLKPTFNRLKTKKSHGFKNKFWVPIYFLWQDEGSKTSLWNSSHQIRSIDNKIYFFCSRIEPTDHFLSPPLFHNNILPPLSNSCTKTLTKFSLR